MSEIQSGRPVAKPVAEDIPVEKAWKEGRRVYVRAARYSKLEEEMETKGTWDGEVGANWIGTSKLDSVLPAIRADLERLRAEMVADTGRASGTTAEPVPRTDVATELFDSVQRRTEDLATSLERIASTIRLDARQIGADLPVSKVIGDVVSAITDGIGNLGPTLSGLINDAARLDVERAETLRASAEGASARQVEDVD
ncbi:hypothetical protein ACQPW1_10445 [Nocardia sp. CA-128927]|uniref:hypothetical protein n=1 Tax=Nocardia sp. CA-128927 TaxID=3239975 RepID=UPI003D95D76A